MFVPQRPYYVLCFPCYRRPTPEEEDEMIMCGGLPGIFDGGAGTFSFMAPFLSSIASSFFSTLLQAAQPSGPQPVKCIFEKDLTRSNHRYDYAPFFNRNIYCVCGNSKWAPEYRYLIGKDYDETIANKRRARTEAIEERAHQKHTDHLEKAKQQMEKEYYTMKGKSEATAEQMDDFLRLEGVRRRYEHQFDPTRGFKREREPPEDDQPDFE